MNFNEAVQDFKIQTITWLITLNHNIQTIKIIVTIPVFEKLESASFMMVHFIIGFTPHPAVGRYAGRQEGEDGFHSCQHT
jgi:hypothetical protein